MQEILPLDLLANFPDDTRILGKRLGLGHCQQGMFIHRILVILVELHQAPDRSKIRDELLQQMGSMHRSKSAGYRSRSGEDLQKDSADIRGPETLVRHAIHVAVDLVQQVGVDLEAPGPRQLEQLEEQIRTIQDPSPQLGWNGQIPTGHHEITVHLDDRQNASRSAPRLLSR